MTPAFCSPNGSCACSMFVRQCPSKSPLARSDVLPLTSFTFLKGTRMNHAFDVVIFGLAASLCWGSGDFNGGLASRRASASSVVIAAYVVGFVLLVALALLWREPFPS